MTYDIANVVRDLHDLREALQDLDYAARFVAMDGSSSSEEKNKFINALNKSEKILKRTE